MCVGSKHIRIMRDEVKGQGQEHTTLCEIVCIGGLMKQPRQGGCCARIIRHVMEGVHKEFRFALRENT